MNKRDYAKIKDKKVLTQTAIFLGITWEID
jgi:hypothetical protein